jgi:hypothetical protein
MEQGKITPIYGQWLKENIGYYHFNTPEAHKLANELNDLDISKIENNQKLIDLYAAFVKMFCNSMHSEAFGINEKDISTKVMKAYLVENEYGVMAPIAFMEAYGKQAAYNYEGSAIPVAQKLDKINNDLVIFQNVNTEMLKLVDETPLKKRPKIWKIILGILLLLVCSYGMFKNIDLIKSEINNEQTRYLWIIIALILLLTLYLGIRDLFSYNQWKQYLINKIWMKDQISKKANDSGNQSNFTAVYTDLLKEAFKNDPQEIPAPPVTVKRYEAGVNKTLAAIKKMGLRSGKYKSRMGIAWLLVLSFVAAFLFYGVNQWDYRNMEFSTLFHLGNGSEEASTDTEAETTDNFQNFNAFDVTSYEASSELHGKKSGVIYSCGNTLDGDLTTCWQDGVEGDGIGEALTYTFDTEHPLVYIDVWNGRQDNEEKYFLNNRIGQAEIICYSGSDVVYDEMIELKDAFDQTPGSYYLTDKNQPLYCDSVKIIIQSVYEGSKYDDTCLTEVKFYEGIYQQ